MFTHTHNNALDRFFHCQVQRDTGLLPVPFLYNPAQNIVKIKRDTFTIEYDFFNLIAVTTNKNAVVMECRDIDSVTDNAKKYIINFDDMKPIILAELTEEQVKFYKNSDNFFGNSMKAIAHIASYWAGQRKSLLMVDDWGNGAVKTIEKSIIPAFINAVTTRFDKSAEYKIQEAKIIETLTFTLHELELSHFAMDLKVALSKV